MPSRPRHLQLCSATANDLPALRRMLRDPEALNGVHLHVIARNYDEPRDPARIRTIPVITDRRGHIDIVVESGAYRFMPIGSGTVTITAASISGISVETLDATTVTVAVAADCFIGVTARDDSTVTLTPAHNACGYLHAEPTAAANLANTTVKHRIVTAALPPAPTLDKDQ